MRLTRAALDALRRAAGLADEPACTCSGFRFIEQGDEGDSGPPCSPCPLHPGVMQFIEIGCHPPREAPC